MFKFCDKCSKETTHDQQEICHPDPYSGSGHEKPARFDVCTECKKNFSKAATAFFLVIRFSTTC
jgi:hypothetical protein